MSPVGAVLNLHDIARIAIPGTMTAVLALLLVCGGCSDDATSPDPTSNGLSELPADSGGVHLALPHDPDGAGERGEWAPPHPMIVVSPQCHSGWWNADDIRGLLAWIDRHYPVDRSHIYLTGLSMGGYGTWNYLGHYGDAVCDSLPVAAAAPICGAGNTSQAAAMEQTPIWAFHGTAEGTVAPSGSVSMIVALGALAPAVPPRLTLYDGVGHDSWSRTYNGDGIGQGLDTYADAPDVNPWLVPYDVDLYTWFFTHQL